MWKRMWGLGFSFVVFWLVLGWVLVDVFVYYCVFGLVLGIGGIFCRSYYLWKGVLYGYGRVVVVLVEDRDIWVGFWRVCRSLVVKLGRLRFELVI